MALPPLATEADLAAAGATATGPAAALALRRASARVRRYTRQTITLVENETVVLKGGGRILALPERPLLVDAQHPLVVTELSGMTGIELVCVEGRDFTRLGAELTRGEPWYQPTRLMGWPWNRPTGVWAPQVRALYSHGYAEIPDDIVDVVLDLAVLNLSNPENLRSEAIDDYQRTFASETIGGATLSQEHKDALRPYRRAAFTVAPS
ncbi:hypothetical protein ACH4GK_17900 [Streptomyces rimosus]|uniref:hypothetical protein n=1 Tax=Streptomyces rimosus TaxID=1927 RepID=UPI0004CC6347|nr:hypothetical protein [Streptomyces rimosus]